MLTELKNDDDDVAAMLRFFFVPDTALSFTCVFFTESPYLMWAVLLLSALSKKMKRQELKKKLVQAPEILGVEWGSDPKVSCPSSHPWVLPEGESKMKRFSSGTIFKRQSLPSYPGPPRWR